MKVTVTVARYIDPHDVTIAYEQECQTPQEALDFAWSIIETTITDNPLQGDPGA